MHVDGGGIRDAIAFLSVQRLSNDDPILRQRAALPGAAMRAASLIVAPESGIRIAEHKAEILPLGGNVI